MIIRFDQNEIKLVWYKINELVLAHREKSLRYVEYHVRPNHQLVADNRPILKTHCIKPFRHLPPVLDQWKPDDNFKSVPK